MSRNLLDDDDEDESISTNSDQDIDSVLELLDAVHRDSQAESVDTNTVEQQDNKIILDIQEPQHSAQNYPFKVDKSSVNSTESEPEHLSQIDAAIVNKSSVYSTEREPEQATQNYASKVDKSSVYSTESEPEHLSQIDTTVVNKSSVYSTQREPEHAVQNYEVSVDKSSVYSTESEPERANELIASDKREHFSDKKSFVAVNGELTDSDDDSDDSDVSIDKYQDNTERNEPITESNEQINADSSLTVEEERSSLTPKEELLTVELEKRGSGGLGFTLAGGADTMGGCFVRDIIGDPAKEDGRLQKGDQILQVDDIDIRDMKHMAAVNVLRATKKNVKLIVLRRPTMVVNDGSSLETVNLTRTSRGRIGLLLTEGDDGIILVDDVVPGEPAAVEGNLKHGDRIIEIGGRKVDGIGFLAARQYLDASRPVVQLLVERRNQAAFSKYTMGGVSLDQSLSLSEDLAETLSQSDGEHTDQESDMEQQTEEVIKVELDKGPRGFGFSLVAAPSSEPNVQGIFIKTISPGSVAEKDGRLQVGDQLLTVNQEDVHGLSHARVIGMLRKVTTTVTLEIRRPGDNTRPARQTSNTSPSTRRSPSSNSLDLDITLEDKETLTGSSEVKDEDDIVDLLSAISSTTSETTPTTSPTKPKLSKRDTDSVLSSLLNSIGSPTLSTNTNNLSEIDSNDSDSDDNVGYPPLDTGYPSVDTGYPSVDTGYPSPTLDNRTNNNIPSDSLQRFSSGSLEDKRFSDSSTDRIKTDSEESDSDYDDVDVFDMLHDNSETNKQSQGDRTVGSYIDLPPPLPTTPIPSDDEDVPPLPPRKESLNKSSDDGWSSESDFSSQPKVNGFVSLHSSSSEGDTMTKLSKPLVDVTSGGRYTGHKLKMLIGALQTKLNSNAPSDEFKALREIKPTDNCDAAKHPDNKEKNRYRNVLPFNSTRVRLSGEHNDDYINASHIRVPVGQDTYHYIATQGPLPSTIKDFWQMVWEQGVEVIAMVTLEQEGGKIKCSKYWPDTSHVPLNLPNFQVSLLEKKTSQSFTERTLSLKHLETGESIEVSHLNFTTWPDHGVPKCSIEMVQFVTYMRNLTSSQAPILVHCSAGIGRTGALITVDVALGLIKRDQMFDVDKIIRILREQRQGMIQTKDQYIFCYKACLEVLRSLSG